MGAVVRLVGLAVVGVIAALGFPHHVAAQEEPVRCDIEFDGQLVTYDRCEQLAGPVNATLLWSVNDTSLSGALLSNDYGWVAVAFPGDGTTMVAPAPPPVMAVVGMVTVGPVAGPEVPSAGVYPLLARKTSGVQPLTAAAAAAAGYTGVRASIRDADGAVSVAFVRELQAAPPVGVGPTNILVAVGVAPTSTQTLGKHLTRTATMVTFGGATRAGPLPAPPPAPPSPPPVPAPEATPQGVPSPEVLSD